MTTFKYTHIKEFKRGAKHSDGSPWMCVRCGVEGRRRRNQAIVTAIRGREGDSFKLPVGYCDEHVPANLYT